MQRGGERRVKEEGGGVAMRSHIVSKMCDCATELKKFTGHTCATSKFFLFSFYTLNGEGPRQRIRIL